MLQEWGAMVTPVHCAHHPSPWCPWTAWGGLTSIPSPTLAEFPCEAWLAAANWSVHSHLALPLVLARVWQAGVWASLDTEGNLWLQAMGACQLTCSKGKGREMTCSTNISLMRALRTHPSAGSSAQLSRDPRLEPEQAHLRKNLLPPLAGRL